MMKEPQRRPRVRRGHTGDHEALRQEILEAAFRLTGQGALSMRALSTELGLSAMGLYRYFDSKAAVLQAMWHHILADATATTTEASRHGDTARERLAAGINAFFAYWEAHPAYFTLVFMTAETLVPSENAAYTQAPAYKAALQVGNELTEAFMREVGGHPARLLEARDLRMALMVGYLHARLINRRFPWSNLDALRAHTTRSILLGMEACLRQPPA